MKYLWKVSDQEKKKNALMNWLGLVLREREGVGVLADGKS